MAGYLRDVDPDLLPLLDTAIVIAERFAGKSGARAVPAWARLDTTEQDRLSATLLRLFLRLRAVEPLYVSRSDQYRYDVALRRLEGACQTDYMFRAMAGLHAGTGLPADTSAREIYMAESVRWHLEHSGPDTRIVLAAHNNHIQKTPVVYDGQLTTLPMGQHLRRMLGAGYRALAVTSTADHTAEMYLDEDRPVQVHRRRHPPRTP